MLGYYRFGLALLIAAFHTGWRPGGLAVGAPAAMAFLMISGYGIAALGTQFFHAGEAATAPWRFWLDRVLRIFPQYHVWLAVTAVIVLGLHRTWLFQNGRPDLVNVLCNLTVLPVSFYMYIPSLAALFILPQCWSLSTELLFYALFPALIRLPALIWACALGGLAIFALASLGVLPTETFTYRLIPGTLPYLMLGIAVWRRQWRLQWTIVGGFQSILLVVWCTGHLALGWNRELLLGMLPSYLLLLLAARLRPLRGDRFFGSLTYGIYLSHMAVLSFINASVHQLPSRIAIVLFGAVLLGWVSTLAVEQPVSAWRRRLRSTA